MGSNAVGTTEAESQAMANGVSVLAEVMQLKDSPRAARAGGTSPAPAKALGSGDSDGWDTDQAGAVGALASLAASLCQKAPRIVGLSPLQLQSASKEEDVPLSGDDDILTQGANDLMQLGSPVWYEKGSSSAGRVKGTASQNHPLKQRNGVASSKNLKRLKKLKSKPEATAKLKKKKALPQSPTFEVLLAAKPEPAASDGKKRSSTINARSQKVPTSPREQRPPRKKKQEVFAYEGDADWADFMEGKLVASLRKNLLGGGAGITEGPQKLPKQGSEPGEVAAVAAGLRARALIPAERVRFKDLFKRKSGVQEYLTVRNLILSLWEGDVRRVLSLKNCGVSRKPTVEEASKLALMRQIYDFLHESGYINGGIAGSTSVVPGSNTLRKAGQVTLTVEALEQQDQPGTEASMEESAAHVMMGLALGLEKPDPDQELDKSNPDSNWLSWYKENIRNETKTNEGAQKVSEAETERAEDAGIAAIMLEVGEGNSKEEQDQEDVRGKGVGQPKAQPDEGTQDDKDQKQGQETLKDEIEQSVKTLNQGVQQVKPLANEMVTEALQKHLKSVDFETTTEREVREQMEGILQVDLKDKKKLVRGVIERYLRGETGEEVEVKAKKKRTSEQAGLPEAKTLVRKRSKNMDSRSTKVIVIGAGPAGLTAARHLQKLGMQVTVLEARERVGGRVYTDRTTFAAPVDLGASIITGVEAEVAGERQPDPSALLCRQLAVEVVPLRSNDCPLHDVVTGKLVPPVLDDAMEAEFNSLLDDTALLAAEKADAAGKLSLEDGLEKALLTRRKKIANKSLNSSGKPVERQLSEREEALEEAVKQPLSSSAIVADMEKSEPLRQEAVLEDPNTVPVEHEVVKPMDIDAPEKVEDSGDKLGASTLQGTLHSTPASQDFLLVKDEQPDRVQEPGHDRQEVKASDKAEAIIGPTLEGSMVGPPLIKEEERRVLNWHFANLEYGCAAPLREVSLANWNQDDAYGGFGGPHCMIKGGYGRLMEVLGEGLDIRLGCPVVEISYDSKSQEGSDGEPKKAKTGVLVLTKEGTTIAADAALITVPLGCLKTGDIQFSPSLPDWKAQAIQRLGFGTLDKIVMQFPAAFWDLEKDFFGATAEETGKRGYCFMFWNLQRVSGCPLLLGLIVGDSAKRAELAGRDVIVSEALRILRRLFGDSAVPTPTATAVTCWGQERYSRGAYSYVAVGASGLDYDLLAAPVEQKLFFAGEATCKEHPDTVGGAMLSGIREAVRLVGILEHGVDYTGEGEALVAAQRAAEESRAEVREFVRQLAASQEVSPKGLQAVPPVPSQERRAALLDELLHAAKTSGGRLLVAKELLQLPEGRVRSLAGRRKGLATINTWLQESLGRETGGTGSQLLRLTVKILLLAATNLAAVRSSGVARTIKEQVADHPSREVRVVANELVRKWVALFRRQKLLQLKVQKAALPPNLGTPPGAEAPPGGDVEVEKEEVEGERVPSEAELALRRAQEAALKEAQEIAKAYAEAQAAAQQFTPELPAILSFSKYSHKEKKQKLKDKRREKHRLRPSGSLDLLAQEQGTSPKPDHELEQHPAESAQPDSTPSFPPPASDTPRPNDPSNLSLEITETAAPSEGHRDSSARKEKGLNEEETGKAEESPSGKGPKPVEEKGGVLPGEGADDRGERDTAEKREAEERAHKKRRKELLAEYITSLVHPVYRSKMLSKEDYKEIMKKAMSKVLDRQTPEEVQMPHDDFLTRKRKQKIRLYVDHCIETFMKRAEKGRIKDSSRDRGKS